MGFAAAAAAPTRTSKPKQTPKKEEPVLGVAAVAQTKVGAAMSLRKAGFDFKMVLTGGFTLAELVAAGYPVKLLKNEGGYKCSDMKEAGVSAYQAHRAGWDAAALTEAGYSKEDVDGCTGVQGNIGAELKALSFVARLQKRREAAAAAAAAANA